MIGRWRPPDLVSTLNDRGERLRIFKVKTIDHRHENADSELTNRCTNGAASVWNAPGTLSLLPPRIPLVLYRLDAGMQVAGVDSGFQQHVLGGGELLAQFGVLGRKGEE